MREFLLCKNLSIRTINSYIYWIKKFELYSQKNKGNLKEKIVEYKEYCMSAYSVETQKVIISALLKYIEFHNKQISLKLPKSHFQFKGNFINKKEFEEFLNSIIYENNFVSFRNKEIVKVLWSTGLRVSELINLKWNDINGVYIKIISKNNKVRMIPYKNDLFDEIKKISHFKSKYVFTKINGDKISYISIYKIFSNYKKRKISPHTLRHSFATRLINKGVPIYFVQELLGHENINTTMLYIHLDKSAIIKELEKKEWC